MIKEPLAGWLNQTCKLGKFPWEQRHACPLYLNPPLNINWSEETSEGLQQGDDTKVADTSNLVV